MSELLLGEAIDLAHALTHQLLADAGVRSLAFKGPVAQVQGLRTQTRRSTDVDILCDPGSFDAACRAVERAGWTAYRGNSRSSQALGGHATTYVIPGWPCTIDLHNRFPGLLAPPATAFEALWAGRATLTIAHHDMTVPGIADHFVMLAVNGIRSVPVGIGEEHPDLSSAWSLLDEPERRRAVSFAYEAGATEPLRGVFRGLGIDLGPVDPRFAAAWRAWLAFRESPEDSGRTWTHRLSAVPWRERPARLAAAIWDVSLDTSRTPAQWATAGAWVRSRARAARTGRALRVGTRTVARAVFARRGQER